MANIVVHVKHKKPIGGFLCEEEKVENREMEKIRRKIESVFERPKNCFKILREKFRMRVKKYSIICPFLMAIGEEIRRFEQSPGTYRNEWQTEIPQIQGRVDKRRKKRKVSFSDYFFLIFLRFHYSQK
jgi:hypothetical protein